MRNFYNLGIAAIVALSFITPSCSSDDDPTLPDNITDITFTFSKPDFSKTGEWIHCYDATYDDKLTFDGYTFPRTATVTEYDGIKYYSWKGFTPSVSTDTGNHAGQWITYQWGEIGRAHV